MSNIEVVQELYRAFRAKDYDAFRQITTEDLEWSQNVGFPGGSIWKGSAQVVEHVFKANDDRWENFSYRIERLLDAGDSVIVLGMYRGLHRRSGKSMQSAAAHVYDFRDGKVCCFQMFADTKTIWDAMA